MPRGPRMAAQFLTRVSNAALVVPVQLEMEKAFPH
jgi:hypothetical protein